MRLHLADIDLHRARLFGLMTSRPADYPWTSPRDDLDAAGKLIDECDYGRRREELADAEAAYARVYGGARSASAGHSPPRGQRGKGILARPGWISGRAVTI